MQQRETLSCMLENQSTQRAVSFRFKITNSNLILLIVNRNNFQRMEKSICSLISNGHPDGTQLLEKFFKMLKWKSKAFYFAMAVTLQQLTKINSPVNHPNVKFMIKLKFNHVLLVTLAKDLLPPQSKLVMVTLSDVNLMPSLVSMQRLPKLKTPSGLSKMLKSSTSSWMFALATIMVAMGFSGDLNSIILRLGSLDQRNNSSNLKSNMLDPVHMYQ